MQTEEVKIEIYDKREKMTSTMYVEQLANNTYRMTENDVFNCKLTLGTEFETRINRDGKHEIVRIIKHSEFITRRFFLTSQFRASDYKLLGDEIVRQGGFWQVDFGSVATINLPQNIDFDIDAIFKSFEFHPTEIKE